MGALHGQVAVETGELDACVQATMVGGIVPPLEVGIDARSIFPPCLECHARHP
jgi:hypothetical protein